jgi:hypothetical protein
MAKQTFTTGQVLTAAQMTSLQQTAMGGGSTTAKTTSYTLVAADAGTVIQMNSASATTITVNTALFAAGDTVQIQNIGAGVCTVTAGTATVNTAGSLALSQWEGGQLYFTATGASIFFDVIQAASSASYVGAIAYGAVNLATSSTATAISSLTTEIVDTNTFHSTATNTSRMTIPTGYDGKYMMQLDTTLASTTANSYIYAYKNGTAITEGIVNGKVGAFLSNVAQDGHFNISLIITGVATDYFEFFISTGGVSSIDKARYAFTYLGA